MGTSRVLVVAALLLLAQNGICCSCSELPFTKQHFDYNRFIFVGKVISFRPLKAGEAKYGGTHVAEFAPYKTWKGLPSSNGNFFIECTPSDGCGESYTVGYYDFICTEGHASMCDFGWPLNSDPEEKGFGEKLDDFVASMAIRYDLEQMVTYYKKYGSLERYYSRTEVKKMTKGQRVNYYAADIPFSVDPDTVLSGWVLTASKFYTGSYSENAEPDSMYNYYEDGTPETITRYGKGESREWISYYPDGARLGRGVYDELGNEIISEDWRPGNILWWYQEKTPYGYLKLKHDEKTGHLLRRYETDSTGIETLTLYRADGSVYCTGRIVRINSGYGMRDFFKIADYYNIKGEKVVENGTGHLVEWYNDTLRKLEADVVEGIWCGHIREWNSNGELYSEEFYEPSAGVFVYVSMIGELSGELYQVGGKPYGVHRQWFHTGELWWEDTYQPDGVHYHHHYFENNKWQDYSTTETLIFWSE